MLRIDVATLFPEMCETVLNTSIIGRARKAGKVALHCHNIRQYTPDKRHGRVDDSPYGGGMGMVMQPEPIYRCYLHVVQESGSLPHVIYLSPQGSTLTQGKALSLREKPHLFLLCGHYEGVDERVLTRIVDEEISIGDYVLTGGELGALVLIDSVVRLCEGVLPSSECFENESHMNGLLEHPQYTRPEIWEGVQVPAVLLSGHHKKIEAFRAEQSLLRTEEKRPDLFAAHKQKA